MGWKMVDIGQQFEHKQDYLVNATIVDATTIDGIEHFHVEITGPGRNAKTIFLSEWGLKLSYKLIPINNDTEKSGKRNFFSNKNNLRYFTKESRLNQTR